MSTEDIPRDVAENVDKLVTSITSSQIDPENFKRCMDFVLYQISSNKYSIPNRTQTQKLLETYSTKYDYLGFSHYAEELSACVDDYVKADPSDRYDNVEHKWRILEFLTKLANDPFQTENIFSLEEKLKNSRNVVYPEEIFEEECINWYQYLQEGSEKFKLPSDEESDDESFTKEKSFKEPERQKSSAPLYNDIFQGFPSKESVIMDEKATILAVLSEAVQSKNWLMNHTQNSWWYEYHCLEPDSKYSSSNFGIRWDKAQNTLIYSSQDFHGTKYQYYTEYKIIRELFWLLITNNKQRISKRIEFLRSQISTTTLIKETFSLFINDILDTAIKYHELRSFIDEIFNDNVLQVPFTYQAYASVLRHICSSFLEKIVQLEGDVRKPDTINTLLRVQNELKPNLEEINFVYDIHSTSLHPNWRNEPAWLITIRLLTTVYSQFHVLLSQSYIRILLKIFFKTFKAYADIIDQWLTKGELDDWKNEFFIKRLDDGTCIVFPCDNPAQKDDLIVAPFFQQIADRLTNCSKNVDFLYKLHKMSQLRSEILKEGTLIRAFVKEFTKRVFYQASPPPNATIAVQDQKSDNFVAHSKVQFLSQDSFNPYLVRCFAQELNIASKSPAIHKEEDIFDELDHLPDLDVFSISSVVENSLYDVIGRRENIIVNFFKSSLVQEYRLFDHIRNLSDLLLMDMHGFCNRINIRLDKRIWEGNHIMKALLHGCVESNKLLFGDLVHFTMDQEDQYAENLDVSVSEIIRIIDTVHLQYMVQWPMNMIFNDNIIKNFYEKLFKLVLKVNTAFSSVTRLCYKDLPHSKLFMLRSRRMYMFRYWVVQLLYKLKSYLSLIISQCLDINLIEKIVEISTFSSLQTHYSKYLESIKKKCLIYPEIYNSLESAFNRIWLICDDVRDLWSKSIKLVLTDQDVSRSVELYVQCLWYLTEILEKFVKNKPTNPLHDLWLDLSHVIEIHRSTIPEDLPFR